MHVDPVTGIITEFRYFYQMMPVRPLSAHAQAFWFFLLYRANAAFWQFPLQIQLNEIAGALRLSRSSVQRARDELVKQGYVLYEHDAGSHRQRSGRPAHPQVSRHLRSRHRLWHPSFPQGLPEPRRRCGSLRPQNADGLHPRDRAAGVSRQA